MKRPQRNRILVPIDFQEQSLLALEQTFVLAKHEKATIDLLYIIESGDFLTEMFRSHEHTQKIEAVVKEKLDELADQYTEQYNIPVKPSVVLGKPAESIIQFANENHVSCIVMGRGQKSFLGSNAAKVIERASQPVITIASNNHVLGFKTVVLCLDLTQPSKEHLVQTIMMSKHFGATVHVVSVLMADVDASKSRIWVRMKRVENILIEYGVPCVVKLLSHSKHVEPYKTIIEYAHEVKADLMGLMTHKENSQRDNYIGAFARQIINETDIPVLTITHAAIKVEKPILANFVDPVGVLDTKKKMRKLIPSINLWTSRKRPRDISE